MKSLDDMVGHGIASINILVCHNQISLLPAAYDELLCNDWPTCFGEKPQGWDDMPTYRRRFMSKRICCKENVANQLMEQITQVIPFQNINRYWIKKNHHFI